MFMVVKKRRILYVFSALLIISILFVCIASKEAREDAEPEKYDEYEARSAAENKTLLIDAGHGGFDAGASANGAEEKDLNLAVALELKECAEKAGGNVVMTRSDDTSTEEKNRSDGTSAKKSDLKKRKAMAEECDADVMISIHMNKYTDPKYWGAQVFYAENSEESRFLGEAVQKKLAEVLGDGNRRAAKKSNGEIYILRNVNRPSVIVECGFLSNPEEAKKLADKDYQSKLAQAIFAGIEDFFNKSFQEG